MHLSNKRSPLGRQLLSKTSKRQAKEVQRLRRNPRAVRSQACRDDRRKESGDRRGKSKTKRGRRLRRPQWLVRSKQRREIKNGYLELLLFFLSPRCSCHFIPISFNSCSLSSVKVPFFLKTRYNLVFVQSFFFFRLLHLGHP